MPRSSTSPFARIETTIEAVPEALQGIYLAAEEFWQSVDRLAQSIPHPPDKRWRMQFDTAVWEIGTNIVRHGHPPDAGISGVVELQFSLYHNRVEAHFTDHGLPWEEPTGDVAEGNGVDPAIALPESGLGLYIVRSILDTFNYTRTDDGVNRWELVKLLIATPDQ